jgi:tetraprenyl-beta-curcumene synthase
MDAHGRQTIGTFARGALNYWADVFPRVCLLVANWRRDARRIPDPQLRRLALQAFDKRANIEGAAAFAAFAPRTRRVALTRALSSFQGAYNYLDMIGEQTSADPVADGRRLHEALVYAVDPDANALDWYEHHPQRDDGGYLQSFLDGCRGAFADLPSQRVAVPGARAAAERIVAFQSLNLSESQGDHEALREWAVRATPAGSDLRWWETAASAGSSLGVFVQLAAAADPGFQEHDAAALAEAYFPWIGALHSLLDNLVDKHEDDLAGQRSFVDYYDSPDHAAQRMTWLAEQSLRRVDELQDAKHHRVILAAMIGNYLSTPQARTPKLLPVTEGVLAHVGELERPTMLVFKLRHLFTRRPTVAAETQIDGAQERAPSPLDNFG